MKISKLPTILILILILTLSQTIQCTFADTPQNQAQGIAEQALKSYKNQIEGVKFNFHSQSEFQASTIGDSLPVYNFDLVKLSQGSADLKSAIYDLGLIQYIVKSNDKAVTRLTLKKVGDTYKRHGFGGSGENLAKGLASLPAEAKMEAKLVMFGSAEFLYINHNGQKRLSYISSVALEGIQQHKLYKTSEILPILKKMAQYSIANSDTEGGMAVPQNPSMSAIYRIIIVGMIALGCISLCVFLIYKDKWSFSNK